MLNLKKWKDNQLETSGRWEGRNLKNQTETNSTTFHCDSLEKETTLVLHMGNFILLQVQEHESLSEEKVGVWVLPLLPAQHQNYFITEGCSEIKVMTGLEHTRQNDREKSLV